MGDLFRCEPMTPCDIYLQPQCAYSTLSELGELGIVQFIDMNEDLNAFQRSYVTEVMRCAEMERKLRYIEDEMIKDEIEIFEPRTEPRAPAIGEMLMFEGIIEQWVSEIEVITANERDMKKSYLQLMEMFYVYTQIGPILGDTDERRNYMLSISRALGDDGHLSIFTGVVNRSKCYAFEMMLWRMTHGNVYYRQALQDEILEDPHTGQGIRKVAFLAVCQGKNLDTHIRKVCSGFRANLYDCPFSIDERQELTHKIRTSIRDLDQIMIKTRLHLKKTLKSISLQWMHWKISIKKMKAIYHTMNLFNVDVTKKCLLGRCWVPTRDLPQVRDVLENCDQSSSQITSFLSKIVTSEEPPTYNKTNKFTKAFQNLISAYGVATYGEINPALYTIITFPFLFSIMFGDLGHGLILALFGIWMVKYESSLEAGAKKNEVWGIFFSGRYLILLMGLFSMYAGFIYNDIFSKSFNLFGSHWINTYSNNTLLSFNDLTLDPRIALTDDLYPVGVDPVWEHARNKIMFGNSLKMKCSIIIGVIHMIFGVTLSVINFNYFKRRYSIILEFIPQILFLSFIFFYLVVLMFYKWFTYSGEAWDPKLHSGCAPLVLLMFIDMMLFSKSKPVAEGCDAYMFNHQYYIQLGLLLTAIVFVPILLFGKPLYLLAKMKSRKVKKEPSSLFRKYQRKGSDRRISNKPEDESFSEIMIHQGVHTIEFVLSTVSHTASYLRLWALSLAHARWTWATFYPRKRSHSGKNENHDKEKRFVFLFVMNTLKNYWTDLNNSFTNGKLHHPEVTELSEMLWQMVLAKNGLKHKGPTACIFIVCSFAVWATFTMSILVLMEGLSAFLHTLRLHWVEFMSKFYMGNGHPFHPFSFDEFTEKDEKEVKK